MIDTILIIIVVMATIVMAVIVFLSLRRQRKAVNDEVNRLLLRLTAIEMKIEAQRTRPQADPSRNEANQAPDELSQSGDSTESEQAPLPHREESRVNLMTDEELFSYLSKTIRDEELFRQSDLNRRVMMERFSLSAVRIGNAFSRGGGMSLPEFVRNCRLDYACRLMVEHPEMPFTEVGNLSGYRRTTTFNHDFKARFGIPPAEYREQKLRKPAEP